MCKTACWLTQQQQTPPHPLPAATTAEFPYRLSGVHLWFLCPSPCVLQVTRLQRERDDAVRARDSALVERDVALAQVGHLTAARSPALIIVTDTSCSDQATWPCLTWCQVQQNALHTAYTIHPAADPSCSRLVSAATDEAATG